MLFYEDRHYGLAGRTVKVKWKNKSSEEYPWDGRAVPVRITGEYPSYLCGIVEKHRNPHGLHPSRPYPITISKFDIHCELIIINGGNIR